VTKSAVLHSYAVGRTNPYLVVPVLRVSRAKVRQADNRSRAS
jgi:hypothetical protein